MSWDPRSIIDTSEYGDSFPSLDMGIEKLLKMAQESGYSALVSGRILLEGVTRFAVSQVTQHHDLNTLSFSLTLYHNKRRASVTTTLLHDLDALFSQAVDGLKSSPPNDFDQGFPDPKNGTTIDLSAKPWSIEQRSETVVSAVNAAEEIDPSVIVAGTASSTITFSRIVSTEGLDVENAGSSNYFKINSILGSPESRGYGQDEVYWRDTPPIYEDMARSATETARDTLTLKTMKAGDYEVVLAPRAVTDLINFVQFGTDPVRFHEGTSFVSDRIGDQIFDKKITIEDLPRNPRKANIVRLYDTEGIPTSNRMFFDKGVLTFIPYDSFSSSKYLGDKNLATGNSLSDFGGAFVSSAVMKLGNKSLSDQIREVSDGLFVKSFWYNRFTDPKKGGLTGLTRNGLYHIKDGEIIGAVRNLRYTESFVQALSEGNVISVGNVSQMFMMNTVPSLHLQKYHFSSIAHTM